MPNNIAETAKVFANVHLGENVTIEDYCIIGCPPRGKNEGELETVIADNAIIRSHTVVYAGNIVGKNFQTGNKVNIRELNTIGDNVSIGTLSIIEHHVEIENDVRIHSQAFVPEFSTLKEGAWLGPNVVLTNAAYPCSPQVKENLEGPLVEENAKIGANATLLPGVVIGKNSLVGAGAVVSKNVAPETVVIGNPARVIKEIKELPYE